MFMHNDITFHAGHDVIWLMLVALASPIRHLSLAFNSGYLNTVNNV